jgi:hypothetical protein
MHGTTSLLLQERLRNQKEYTTKFISGYFDCHRYLYPGKFSLSGSFTHAWHPGASDIAGNGIMFASNDRVGAAAAGMIMGNSSVFIMAGLIMVSTFGCNSGLIPLVGDFMRWLKTAFSLNKLPF